MGWHIYLLLGCTISETNGTIMKQTIAAAPNGRYVCLIFLNDIGSFLGTEMIVLSDCFQNYWEQLAGMVVGRLVCPALSVSDTPVPAPCDWSAPYYAHLLLLPSLCLSCALLAYVATQVAKSN